MMNKMRYEVLGGKMIIKNVELFLKSIADFSEKHGVYIQVFNADMICGKIHLQSAADHAIRAMAEKSMATNSIQMEVLLYAAGERQINHAITKVGVKKQNSAIGIVFFILDEKKDLLKEYMLLFTEQFKINVDNNVLNSSLKKIHRWKFSENEIRTMHYNDYENLILEKIALVDIIK